MKKKLVFFGYYGKNFGDLIMLDVLVSKFRDDYEVSVVSYAKRPAYSYHSIPGVAVLYLDDLAPLDRWLSVLRLMRKSDVFCWGGGTCFFDEGGTGAIKYFLIARLLGVKIWYLSIGVGVCDKTKTRLYLKLAALISEKIFVRDKRSYTIFAEFNHHELELVNDAAHEFDLTKIKKLPGTASCEYVLVAYRGLTEFLGVEKNNTCLLDSCAAVEKYCKEASVNKIVILPTDVDVDLQDSIKIRDYFCGKVETKLLDGPTLSDTLNLIVNAKFILTGRLHVGHFALKTSVPFALINYSPKNKQFVLDNGVDFCLLDPLNISKSDLNIIELCFDDCVVAEF